MTVVADGVTKSKGHKLWLRRFGLDAGEGMQPWGRSPEGLGEPPSLEKVQVSAWQSHSWPDLSLAIVAFWAGGWNRDFQKSPPTKYSYVDNLACWHVLWEDLGWNLCICLWILPSLMKPCNGRKEEPKWQQIPAGSQAAHMDEAAARPGLCSEITPCRVGYTRATSRQTFDHFWYCHEGQGEERAKEHYEWWTQIYLLAKNERDSPSVE